ncbi:hypothetical protein D3C80_1509760 [compost metagenome]
MSIRHKLLENRDVENGIVVSAENQGAYQTNADTAYVNNIYDFGLLFNPPENEQKQERKYKHENRILQNRGTVNGIEVGDEINGKKQDS